MKKQLLSMSILTMLLAMPITAMAQDIPAIQYVPVEQSNEYQTQYPVPVNNYQTQSYAPAYDNNVNTYTQQYNQQQLSGNVIFVPANTQFTASVMTPLNSEDLSTGDSVMLYLDSDFYYNNRLIAGAGSRVNGTVLKSKKGGFGSRNGSLHLKFNNIVTTSGQMIPISAYIVTEDGDGILRAGTFKDSAVEYAKDMGVGAASGAVLGTAMGALSGGKVGRGAVYGTALGGGLGLIKSIADKGDNVVIPQNAQINLVLTQPITVSANTIY